MRRALVVLLLVACNKDPAAGFAQTKAEARNYDCHRYSQEEAHERYPGLVPDAPPRGGNFGVKDALICRRRIVDWGERDGRDEVILTSLRPTVDEIVRLAGTAAPPKARWYVDAFYSSPHVAQKISVAARVGLVERGQQVSDQVPVLAAGDIAVLARMEPAKAYGVACKRYLEEHVLERGEVFLGIMTLDSRESQLHAGVCIDGEWRWVQ